MAGLYIQPKLRPCYIICANNERTKGLFHCWNHINDGVISHTAAIIELADGRITNIRPESIIFLDNPFQDYVWEENKNE